MNTKLQQWGATLFVFGAASLVMPLLGVQLRIFNLFGANQKAASIAAIAIGGVMWLIGAGSKGLSKGSAGAAAPVAAGTPPPIPAAVPGTFSSVCPKCGATAAAGDRFCMSCGTPIPQTAAVPPPVPVAATPATAKPRSHFALGCLVVVVLLLAGIAWFFFGPSKGSSTAARKDPALPTAVAGTMTEFPVDPEPKNPLQPTSVVSQTFTTPGSSGSSTLQTPAETLPPGVNGSNIAQVAQGMTSTTYRDPNSPGVPVNVHVLGGANVNQAGSIAQGIAQSAGATMQGVQVQSPQGQTYEGYSMQTATIMVYVLVNRSASTIIILYTPQPQGFVAIKRLASSVGNGQGLGAYPQLINTYGALPASPPPGYVVTTVRTFTGGELRAALTQNEAQLGKEAAQAIRQAFEAFQMFIPEEGTMAVYNNSFRQEKGIVVGRYGNARKAAVCWRVLAWTVGWTMKKTSVGGMDGLTFQDSSTRVIILRKGPFLAMAMVPGASTEQELLDLAGGIQF